MKNLMMQHGLHHLELPAETCFICNWTSHMRICGFWAVATYKKPIRDKYLQNTDAVHTVSAFHMTQLEAQPQRLYVSTEGKKFPISQPTSYLCRGSAVSHAVLFMYLPFFYMVYFSYWHNTFIFTFYLDSVSLFLL